MLLFLNHNLLILDQLPLDLLHLLEVDLVELGAGELPDEGLDVEVKVAEFRLICTGLEQHVVDFIEAFGADALSMVDCFDFYKIHKRPTELVL